MNPQPVYNSFEVERIVEFKTIFPRSALPKISECFRGYDKEHMLGGLLANLANKVVGKPFYNPNYRGNEEVKEYAGSCGFKNPALRGV